MMSAPVLDVSSRRALADLTRRFAMDVEALIVAMLIDEVPIADVEVTVDAVVAELVRQIRAAIVVASCVG